MQQPEKSKEEKEHNKPHAQETIADLRFSYQMVRSGFQRFTERHFKPLTEANSEDPRISRAGEILVESVQKDQPMVSFFMGGLAASGENGSLAVLYLSHNSKTGGAGITPASLLHGVPQYGLSTSVRGPIDALAGEGGPAFIFAHEQAQRAEIALFLSDKAYSCALENFEREVHLLQARKAEYSGAMLFSHEIQSSLTALLVREVAAQNMQRSKDAFIEAAFTGEEPADLNFIYVSVSDLKLRTGGDQVEIEIAGFLLEKAGEEKLVFQAGTPVRQRHFIRLVHEPDCRVQTISEQDFHESRSAAA